MDIGIFIEIHPVITGTSLACGIPHQHIGTVVDGGGVAVGLEAVVVGRVAEGGQGDDYVHGLPSFGTRGMGVEDTFTIVLRATLAPDTEVLLTVLGHRVVFVSHLHIAGGAIQSEGVVVAVVANPTAIVGVVGAAVLFESSPSAPARTGIGAGSVFVIVTGHHVGVADKGTIVAAPLDLDVVTVVHTHLVVAAAERSRRDGSVAIKRRRNRSEGVAAAHATEVGDLGDGGVQEETRAIDDAHTVDIGVSICRFSVIIDFVEAVLLGLVQLVGATLTREVDVRVVEDQHLGKLDRIERTAGLGRLGALGGTIVTDDDCAFGFTGVAGGTASKDGATDVHILGVARLLRCGLVTVAIHIDIGVARDCTGAEGAAEGTPVAACPNGTGDAEGSHLIVDARGGLLVRRILDSVFTDEDIDRAEAVAEEACGIHILVDDTAADVGDAHGRCFGACREATVSQRGIITVVGVLRAAVHIAIDMAACHVDGAHASDEHLLLFALGAAEHMATDNTVRDVDGGGHLRGAHLTTAIHIAFHLAAADANDGFVVGVVGTTACVGHGTILSAAVH